MPSDDDIDKYISDYKGLLGLDDDAWEQWLSDNHYDDASYRDNAAYNLMMKNLIIHIARFNKKLGVFDDFHYWRYSWARA